MLLSNEGNLCAVMYTQYNTVKVPRENPNCSAIYILNERLTERLLINGELNLSKGWMVVNISSSVQREEHLITHMGREAT